MKCIDVKSNAFKVPLLIWIIAILILVAVHPVKAESGSITISKTITIATYFNAGATLPGTVDYNHIRFDNADYTKIFSFQARAFTEGGYSLTFAHDFNSTSFTISGNGGGSGVAWYDKNTSKLYWVFNDDFHATSSIINLTYASNIFADIGYSASKYQTNPGLDVNKPVHIMDLTGNDFIFDYDNVQMKSETTDTYIVTYPAPTLFSINLTKGGTTADKYFITSLNSEYTHESSFNTVSFIFTGVQGSGIYLNGTIASGAYTKILINSSGLAPTPTPPAGGQFNPPLVVPSGGGSIQFNQTKYVVGDTVRVEWAISNTEWNCIVCNSQLLIIMDDKGNLIEDRMDIPTQTGNKTYIATQPGIWTAQLIERFFSDNIVSTATTTIQSQTPSQIIVNSTVAAGIPFNISYSFGFNPSFSGLNNFMQIEQLTNSGYIPYASVAPITCPCTANNIYYINSTIPTPGTYRISLYDQVKGKVATTTTEAVQTFIPIQVDITSPVLVTDKGTYFFGDSIILNYAVDNTNYSNFSQRYIAVKNLNNGLYTLPASNGFQSISLLEQTGNIELQIANTGDPSSCTTSYTCPIFSSITWYPGSTSLEMHVKNSTVDNIIAFANFTLNQVDVNGDGLSVSNTKICVKDSILINASSASNATIKITLSSNTIQIPVVYDTWMFSGSGKTFKEKFSFAGNYQIQLIVNGITKFTYYVTVSSDCGAGTPTPNGTINPGGQGQAGTPLGVIDGWTAMFGMGVNDTSRFLFAVIIIVLVTISGFILTGNNGTGGIVLGFVPYAFFTYINYVPKWFILVAIIIMGIKLRWFN